MSIAFSLIDLYYANRFNYQGIIDIQEFYLLKR